MTLIPNCTRHASNVDVSQAGRIESSQTDSGIVASGYDATDNRR
jgi:hypothetical protein